jgi:surface polysaccharide O-acyltransferase-like enzyme
MKNLQIEKRLFFPDMIRCLAIMMIVTLHVIDGHYVTYRFTNLFVWGTIYLSHVISLAGVPLFVMISGFLLLNPDHEESIATFYYKRLIKVGIPFIIWGLIYLVWIACVRGNILTVQHIIREFAVGPIYGPLWFIYMIISLYLIAPILRVFIKNTKKIYYLLILWSVGLIVELLVKTIFGTECGIQFILSHGFAGFLGYFLLGGLFRNIKPSGVIAAILFLIGFSFTFAGPHLFKTMYFANSLSFNVIMMSTGLFLFIQKINLSTIDKKNNMIKAIIQTISITSFSIYFMHFILMELFRYGNFGFYLSANTIHPFIGIPLSVIVIVAVCIMITLVCRKIPIVRIIFR